MIANKYKLEGSYKVSWFLKKHHIWCQRIDYSVLLLAEAIPIYQVSVFLIMCVFSRFREVPLNGQANGLLLRQTFPVISEGYVQNTRVR
jgi:hypothetical protein